MLCPICSVVHPGHERSPGSISAVCEPCSTVREAGSPEAVTARPAKKTGGKPQKEATTKPDASED